MRVQLSNATDGGILLGKWGVVGRCDFVGLLFLRQWKIYRFLIKVL